MKPQPHTIQWIAPHLSEGERLKIYEAVLKVIGENTVVPPERHIAEWPDVYTNKLREDQRRAAMRLFGMEEK